MGERMWAYSLDGETCWGECDTREEAVAAGLAEAKEEGRPSVFICECWPYSPVVDARSVIDGLYEDALVECGESAEGWLDTATDGEEAMLSEMLTAAVREWMRRSGNEPWFLVCGELEEVEVDDG